MVLSQGAYAAGQAQHSEHEAHAHKDQHRVGADTADLLLSKGFLADETPQPQTENHQAQNCEHQIAEDQKVF